MFFGSYPFQQSLGQGFQAGNTPWQMPPAWGQNRWYTPPQYAGMPNGYIPSPPGVPFNHSPYLPFGSGFGLGLDYFQPGFGRGPGFPNNLWTPPPASQTPQIPGGTGAAGTQDDMQKAVPQLQPFRGATINTSQGVRFPDAAFSGPTAGTTANPWLQNAQGANMLYGGWGHE